MSESINTTPGPEPVDLEERLRQLEETIFGSAGKNSLTPEQEQALRNEYDGLLPENLERKRP